MGDILHLYPTTPGGVDDSERLEEFLYCSDIKPTYRHYPHYCLSINTPESEIIDAGALLYRFNAAKLDALMAELSGRLDLDDSTVRALIGETKNIWDYEFDTLKISPREQVESERTIHHASARAAKLLGFSGIRVTNYEHPIRLVRKKVRGGLYLIDRELAVGGHKDV